MEHGWVKAAAYVDPYGVTNADIDEALRQLRVEAGGHEPYALAVYPRAREIAAARTIVSGGDS